MRETLTTAIIIAMALFSVTSPATAGVMCGWECAELECEYTGDEGTGCEDTRWGFCLDAYCAAGGDVDENAKADALKKVQQILQQQAKPDFGAIVATLEDFYGPSFRISTEQGMIFDAATITGVGLDQTPKERAAQCPTYDAEDSAVAD